jgi:hypothetical protein
MLLLLSCFQLFIAVRTRTNADRAYEQANAAKTQIGMLAESIVDLTLTANKDAPTLSNMSEERHKARLATLLEKSQQILKQLELPVGSQPSVVTEVESVLSKKQSGN